MGIEEELPDNLWPLDRTNTKLIVGPNLITKYATISLKKRYLSEITTSKST